MGKKKKTADALIILHHHIRGADSVGTGVGRGLRITYLLYQSNESNSRFNQVFDFVRNFLKVFAFNKAELFDDFVLVNGEKLVRFDDRTFRQDTDFQIFVF